MAASGDVIKSFLVGLGFDIDESSLAVFNKGIQSAALRITALYGTVNAFSAGIVLAFSKISEGFEEMGYQYHIIAPSINKMIVLRQEMLKAYGAAGINIRKVIVDSVNLNLSLTKTKYALEAIYKSVGSKFFGLLQKQSDMFRKRLYENMPYIIGVLEKLVKTVFKAFTAVTILGGRLWSILGRVYDFFVTLDKATDGWSTVVLGLAAAWRLLNLSFIATPLGALLTGFVALLALFDDFKTWQEGGKSLFNWEPFLPVIDQMVRALKGLRDVWLSIVDVVGNVVLGFYQLFKGDKSGALDSLANAGKALIGIFTNLWDVVKGLGSTLVALGSFLGDQYKNFFGGNAGQPPNIAGKLQGPALGSTPPPGQSNTNANMQTQINITGSPNADATARATAAQQQNVNRDFVRNLKGATR